MVALKEIIFLLLNEAKSILKEYMRDTEAAVKKRIKRMLIYGIIISVLVALVTSFLVLNRFFDGFHVRVLGSRILVH